MFRTATQRPGSRGFTLIEIAVVLLIVGLVTVVGARLVASVAEGTRARLTRQNADAVKLALQAYVARAGRLPCPAIEALPPANAVYGVEAPTPGTCTGTQGLEATPVAFRGVVPWKTLGMTTDNAFDGWGNQFTYAVSSMATNLNASTLSGMRGTIYIHSTAPVAAGLPATGNQINACSTTVDDNSCNAAAVVLLLSHGKRGAGGYTVNGTQVPLPTSAEELENTDNSRSFVLAEPSDNFDDLLHPYSPNDILGPLFVQGVVRPPEALVVERARSAVSLLAAYSASTRSGSSPFLVYSLALPPGAVTLTAYVFDATKFAGCDNNPPGVLSSVTSPLTQVLDPWGNPYRYSQANTGVASSTTCATPGVFVSLGPDGVVGTADDIVYYAPLAEWKDIFSRSGW